MSQFIFYSAEQNRLMICNGINMCSREGVIRVISHENPDKLELELFGFEYIGDL